MTTKVSWLFNYRTDPSPGGANRGSGWSEQWYTDFSPAPTGGAEAAARLWAQARAGLLPSTTQIIGARLGLVGAGNRSRVITLNVPGTLNSLKTDIPSAALKMTLRSSSTANERITTLRGIPDDWVKGGALFSDALLGPALAVFLARLNTDTWKFRGRDFTQPQLPLISIGSDGTYLSAVDLSFVAGNQVQIIRARQTSTGRLRGGTFKIQTVTDARNGKLANWPWGATTDGSMRAIAFGYFQPVVAPSSVVPTLEVTTKKSGRIFFPYRGRRSKR